MKRRNRKVEGCLPCEVNFVSESPVPSFEGGETAWKAGTLPTELLPRNDMAFAVWDTELKL